MEKMKLAGVIQKTKVNLGSKSERLSYRIVDSRGTQTALVKLGDNPFTNPLLASYEGHEVEVYGELDGDVFLVDSIKPVLQK
jgi:hypothetical protein